MKKLFRISLLISFTLLIVGCGKPPLIPEPTPTSSPTNIPTPAPSITPTASVQARLILSKPSGAEVAYDFIRHMCDATWSNNGVILKCPSENTDGTMGAVLYQSNVMIENSILVEQPALLTLPAQKGSGYGGIFGIFPEIQIQNGDRFRAVLACANQMEQCDLTFSLEYFKSANEVSGVPDAVWAKKFSLQGDYIIADIDLSFLAGKKIKFVLTVCDNGNPDQDWGVWLQPHIWRK